MSFQEQILDLVAIPTSENQTTNLIGQTLLYQGFRDSQKANAKKIQLEAIKKSIGNPVEKYIKCDKILLWKFY